MICQPPALMDHTDTFDRANASTLGTAWRNEVSGLVISTNRAQHGTLPSNTARRGAWSTYIGDYGGRLITDNWEIGAPLLAPIGTASTDNYTALGAGMYDNGPDTGMLLVYMIVSRGSWSGADARIMTYSADSIPAPATLTGLTGQTVRETNTTATSDTAVIAFRRRMYSPTQSVFTGYVDGVALFSWDDETGVVPAGDDQRRRWFISSEANYPQFFSTRIAPALASVRARDLTT